MSGDSRLPDDSPEDRDVTRRWREQSAEQPSPATDARIRAAAREALPSGAASSQRARRDRRWSRFVPLAAAASLAMLAVGLVRLIPREEYRAIPVTPESAGRRDAASEAGLPSARAPAPPPPPVETEIADEASPAPEPASQASGPADSPDELRAAREAAAVAADERLAREERAPQAERAAPSVAQGAPLHDGSPAAGIRGPAPAAPPTAITATGDRAATGADAAVLPVELARRVHDDAAQRTRSDLATIRIVAVDPIMWFDTSLGCEAGAMAAPEMRVPGYVVTVDAGGTILRYHTDDGERIRICDEE